MARVAISSRGKNKQLYIERQKDRKKRDKKTERQNDK